MKRGGRDDRADIVDGSAVGGGSFGDPPWWEIWLRHRIVTGIAYATFFAIVAAAAVAGDRRPMAGVLVFLVLAVLSVAFRRSPADHLDARDAARVRSAVRRGRDVGTDRLAACARDEAESMARGEAWCHRWRWPLVVVAAVIVATADDLSVTEMSVISLVVVAVAVVLFTARRRRDRADQALDAATRRLAAAAAT